MDHLGGYRAWSFKEYTLRIYSLAHSFTPYKFIVIFWLRYLILSKYSQYCSCTSIFFLFIFLLNQNAFWLHLSMSRQNTDWLELQIYLCLSLVLSFSWLIVLAMFEWVSKFALNFDQIFNLMLVRFIKMPKFLYFDNLSLRIMRNILVKLFFNYSTWISTFSYSIYCILKWRNMNRRACWSLCFLWLYLLCRSEFLVKVIT